MGFTNQSLQLIQFSFTDICGRIGMRTILQYLICTICSRGIGQEFKLFKIFTCEPLWSFRPIDAYKNCLLFSNRRFSDVF